jgi:hypothetical protein
MAGVAKKTDEKLWSKVKTKVTRGDKGGKPGQWSARKAQLATSEYKAEGGGYKGGKSKDNHLSQWTDEKWGTKSGKKSEDTGERYLPKKAREHLSAEEYRRSTAKKRRDTKAGRQFSAQPKDVAKKAAPYRSGGKVGGKAGGKTDGGEPTKATLYAEAKRRNIAGRSRMSRAELARAVR